MRKKRQAAWKKQESFLLEIRVRGEVISKRKKA